LSSIRSPLGPSAVEPGVAEMMPEPVRPGIDPEPLAAAGDHLVDPVRVPSLVIRCLVRYAGVMRYPDGGGLDAAERARRETARLEAAD
jgi:hypothetical protein